MFSNAGFQITSDQGVPDALVNTLLISGNEAIVSARLRELLGAGLDELLVTLAPVSDTNGDEQRVRLMHLVVYKIINFMNIELLLCPAY